MEGDEGKLFLGGITWETTEETLRDYFSKYGDVTNAAVMRDKTTGRPRGFGFVLFSDPSTLDSVLQDKHTVDGRMVEAKRALSREDQSGFRQDTSNGGRTSGGGGGNVRTKKIFVGGLPPTLSEEEFRQYFGNFGQVTDAVIMFDQSTQRPRGFGFISFDSEDAVDRVLQKNFHDLNGKDVEVKRALPKEGNSFSGNRGNGGGGYQNYGSSRGNSGSYDNRMVGNRFTQPQSAGFSPYPGCNAAEYGGGYGGPTGSYGGYGGGYGGAFPGQAGGYGGSNTANAMKAAWTNQTAGYGSSYGPSQVGQAPGGYGGQTYGDGYGGSGYGAVGGRAGSGPTGSVDDGEQSAAGNGYMGSGYGENNRNAGYGGYGHAQTWQGQ